MNMGQYNWNAIFIYLFILSVAVYLPRVEPSQGRL